MSPEEAGRGREDGPGEGDRRGDEEPNGDEAPSRKDIIAVKKESSGLYRTGPASPETNNYGE